MDHRDDERFELSALLESESNEENARGHEALLLPENPDNFELENDRTHTPPDSIKPPVPTKIEYLDGVRGLAALWVFVQHKMGPFTFMGHIFGWGEDGTHHYFISFHFVRLFFGSGGDAAVVIFFVLSGYVLSISSLRKLKQNQPSECRRALLSALIRRPIRLYAPAFAITFVYGMLLHVPGPLVLPLPWDGGKPQETIWKELAFMYEKIVGYFSIMQVHASNQFAFPYNAAMWTIPIELKGSLLVFLIIFLLSLGMHGPDHKVPMMVALMIFSAAGAMIQHAWKWSMASFMFGIVLAIVDTWPIGEHIRSSLSTATTTCTKMFPPNIRPTSLSDSTERLLELAQDQLETLWIAILSLPRFLTKHLPRGPRHPKSPHAHEKKASLLTHLSFWTGFYLLSQPSSAGTPEHASHTPGWRFLSSCIPEAYDKDHYYRYWQLWASYLVIYGILRISWLQRFFLTRAMKFLGYVSFMLYLTHLNFFRILPDRINNLFGGAAEPGLEGSIWDQTLYLSNDNFLFGIGLRFWVAGGISLASSLGVAWVFTKLVDEPSVRLGKAITRRIGLDKPKSRVEVVLPP